MIQSTAPKVNRVKYAAMLLGALAVAATPLVYPAIATAERVWDIEYFDTCIVAGDTFNPDGSLNWADYKYCCEASGGVWTATSDGVTGSCSAPPGDAKGSRQLPGNAQIPSDIATAPTVTKAPLRPIRVPSDIATVSTVSQGNELAS